METKPQANLEHKQWLPFDRRVPAGAGGEPAWFSGEHLFWPVEKWGELQRQMLIEHVRHAAKTAFYHNRISVDAMNSGALTREIVEQFPFTTKDDLAAAGEIAWGCPHTAVREWVTTSGTSGPPLHVPLTGNDLHRLAMNEAVALGIAGIIQGTAVILAVAMDRQFVAGLAYWLGCQIIGASCVRNGAQNMAYTRTMQLASRQNEIFFITVPSVLAHLQTNDPAGDPAAGGGVHGVIGIGEPLRNAELQPNALHNILAKKFGCPIMSTYAATETCTTFAEGPCCWGGHLNPQMAVVEILDAAGNAVADGTPGEVTMTPLGAEGFPLLRFRTGDIAALYTDACPCGRTTPRLGPILGRKQQMLKVRGSSIFPAAIYDALAGVLGFVDCAIVAQEEHDLSDRLTVHVQMREDSAIARRSVESAIRVALRVLPDIVYCDAAALRELQFSGGSRKAQRFIDRRSRPGA